MPFTTRRALIAAALLTVVLPTLAAAAPAVLFTADTEGHAGPCDACPHGRGLGGLARRAALVAKLRGESPALLLDGGNALFGNDDSGAGPEGGARLVALAYAKTGYDAVNLSYRDFRAGREATLKALADAGLPAVSANIVTDAGQPVVKPYVVIDRGGEKTAVVGVTEAPPGIEFLPHLQRQLAGLRIDPAPAALKTWLPKAKAEAARVVVLYYGGAAGLEPVRAEAAAGGAEAVFVGGVRPESLPASAKPPLVGAAEHGKYVTRFAPGAAPQLIAVEATLAPDPAIQEIIAANSKPRAADAGGEDLSPVTVKLPSLPANPEPDKLYPVRADAGNRGARVTLSAAGLVSNYGSLSTEGRPMLLAATRWENIIPLTLVRDQKVPTMYKIPNLADHLYAVVDGRRLARLHPQAGDQPGHLPVTDFTIEQIGASVAGNVVFALPPGEAKSIEVRFYDYAHGHFAFPLLKAPGAETLGQEKPVSPPLANEVLEVAAFDLKREPSLGDRQAPPGMTFVTLDLRARSTFTVDADAAAFDPKARPGQKTKVGHVADWKESRRYLQLVADGEYAYMPEPETELEEEPRFLPDVMTGGRVVFLAPAEAKSLEVRCDFPNARASTGAEFRPKGLTLALEGKRPALPNQQAIASVDDPPYRLQVTAQKAVTEFAGHAPAAGNKFLVVDVTVFNHGGRNGEFFQTPQQLKYASETGGQVELSPATYDGPRRPAELVWIPPSERRSFQAVFEIPAGETKPRLAFNGVTKAQVLNLKAVEAIAAAPGAPATARPADMAAGNAGKAPANAPGKAPAVAANTPARPAPPASVPPVKEVKPLDKDVKPLRVAAKQPHKPKGIAGVGLTPEQVNASIDRGAEGLWAWKKAEMKKNGTQFSHKLGYDVLVALALVHADYHKKSKEFDAELRGLITRIDPPDLGTYGAGIFIMLIEAYGDGYFLPKLRQTALCLLESQGPEGSWGYTAKAPEAALRDPNAERVLQIRGGLPLEGEGSLGTPMKRVGKFDPAWDGDNSTSQYAMLGLWSSTKAKVPVEPDVWKRALASYRARQCEDGGWAYHTKSSYGYGSMTCAGVCAIALARHHLGEAAPAEDPAIERGLAWLANRFTVSEHPEGSEQHLFYYLYSLERVGRILDTEFIGQHEWYPLGARWLVDNQHNDGMWGDGNYEEPEVAAPLALLFLTRATSTLNPEHKRGGDGKLRTDVAVAPGHRVYVILDCSGSMLPEIDGKQKFEIARGAVASLVESLPDNAEVALRAYGHRRHARQEGADEDTELLLPMAKLDRKAFAAKLMTLRARGKTPLALSLKQAAADVAGIARDKDKPVTVVLLTDGGEDTRARNDPIAAAAEIAKLPGVNLQVVGFDINRPDWTEQLQGIARRGGGQYLTAAAADTLLRELKSAVFRVPDTFVVTTPKGQPVMKAPFGTEKVLPEGQYLFQTSYGGRNFSQPFWINTDATTAVVFDASKVGVDKTGEAGAPAPAPVAGNTSTDKPAPSRPAPPRPAPPRPAPAAGAKKFCTNCGAPLTATARFCTKCGAKTGG